MTSPRDHKDLARPSHSVVAPEPLEVMPGLVHVLSQRRALLVDQRHHVVDAPLHDVALGHDVNEVKKLNGGAGRRPAFVKDGRFLAQTSIWAQS